MGGGLGGFGTAALVDGDVDAAFADLLARGATSIEPPTERGPGFVTAAVERARSRLGEDRYRLWSNNCEHFVHWCLTGSARSRQVEAPSFYLHLQPGNCFIGAGLWHPEPDTQRKIRQFIFDNPGAWKAAVQATLAASHA